MSFQIAEGISWYLKGEEMMKLRIKMAFLAAVMMFGVIITAAGAERADDKLSAGTFAGFDRWDYQVTRRRKSHKGSARSL